MAITFSDLVVAMAEVQQSQRYVVCEPGQRLKIEALVLRYGLDQWWTVTESPQCPPGKLLLINVPTGVLGDL